MASFQDKLISLPDTQRSGNHPDGYLRSHNRDYVRSCRTANNVWVKLWISWQELVPETVQPSDYWQFCALMNSNVKFRDLLDHAIAAANADRVAVMLCPGHYYPKWAVGTTASEPGTNKPAIWRLPADVSPGGPWDFFMAYLYNRYWSQNYQGVVNVNGPNSTSPKGNPLGAWISGLEICNEPNYHPWPQAGIHNKVADMLKTAEAMTQWWGPACAIFGPATADVDDHVVNGVLKTTSWYTFTGNLTRTLREWRPRIYVGWTHHNYRDLEAPQYGNPSRLEYVISFLYANNWRGGGDRWAWLTEGGFRSPKFGTEALQSARISESWHYLKANPDVRLAAQHQIRVDLINGGPDAAPGFVDITKTPSYYRPAWTTFKDMF